MSDKLEKIATLALHPTAQEGEWQAAAIAYIRIHRRMGATSLSSVKPSEDISEPKIFFGKYSGKTLRWIAQNDPAYCEWLIETANGVSPRMRDLLRRKLDEVMSK